MKYLFQPGEGDVLKLGPPWSGEVVIKIDPLQAGGPLAIGMQTLLPGTVLPVHRHLQGEKMYFVHKGQGRATVNDQSTTVVPGALVYVPHQAWHSLRNTGTGALQVTWVVSPPGLEHFFKELSQTGPDAAPTVMEEIGARHGIEFRPAGAPGESASPDSPHRSRRRRRGRGGRGGASRRLPDSSTARHPGSSAQPASMSPAAQSVPSQPAMPAPSAPAGPASGAGPSGSGPRRRRRRGRGGRGRGRQGGQQPQTAAPVAAASGQPAAPTPTRPSRATPSSGEKRPEGDKRRRGGGYRRRVKEVYMGGKWVQVQGDGPVISTD